MHRLVGLVGLVSLVLLVMAIAWGASAVEVVPSPDAAVASPPSPPNAVPTMRSPTAEPGVKRMHMFPVPFTVTVPADAGLKLIHHNGSLVGWSTVMPGEATAVGLEIATANKSFVHGRLGGRQSVAGDPPTFLQRLEKTGGIELGPAATSTIDGRPGLVVDVLDRSEAHLHTNGVMTGPANCCDALEFGLPARLFVFEVGDQTVFIRVSARTDASLAAFLPAAMQLIDSIHFEDPEVLP